MLTGIYWGDVFVLLGIAILLYVTKQYSSSPSSRISMESPGLFDLSSEYHMSRKDIYANLMYALYIFPYVVWLLIETWNSNFMLLNLTSQFIVFTVTGVFITLVVRLQQIYMERHRLHDYLTYIGLGLYYIVIGLRTDLYQQYIPTDIEPIYFPTMLSLTLIFVIAASIAIRDMFIRFSDGIKH